MKIKSMKAGKGRDRECLVLAISSRARLFLLFFSTCFFLLPFSLSFFPPSFLSRPVQQARYIRNTARDDVKNVGRTCKRARAADAPSQTQLMRLLDLASQEIREKGWNDRQTREEGRVGGLGNFKSALIYRWRTEMETRTSFVRPSRPTSFSTAEKNQAC